MKLLESFLEMYGSRASEVLKLRTTKHVNAALVVDTRQAGRIVPDMELKLMERDEIIAKMSSARGVGGVIALLDSCVADQACMAVIFDASGVPDIMATTVQIHKTLDVRAD